MNRRRPTHESGSRVPVRTRCLVQSRVAKAGENHVLKVVRVAVALLAAFCAGMPRQALAQSANASLLIEVRDSAGALLPDTTVLVINQDNGFSRRGTTSAQGTFSVERLPTGTYTLTASRPGYKVEVLNNIRLLTSIKAIVPITLAVGDVREQVEVTADGTTLRTGNSAVGAVYDSNTLLTLPSAEREPLEFATQAAGVAPAAPGSRLSTQGNTGVNSAGAREAANNYLLDGIDNNDLYLNRLVINPSLDSIEEFSILQNTYDAEYGRSAGAQLNIVTKSGTKTLHGSAYEFFRHSALDARNALEPEDASRPGLPRHQFGGTMGGPLGRRSFYFV